MKTKINRYIVLATSVCTSFLMTLTCFSREKDVGMKWDNIAEHPRILMTKKQEQKIKNQLDENPHIKNIHNAIIAEAERTLNASPVIRKKQGKRLLAVSREALTRIFYWSYAYRMTNDKKFATRAEIEMSAVCDFEDWNPSHFLDVGEMCVALGIGYDWLFDVLPENSKEKIRTTLMEKGVIPSGNYGGFLRGGHNWNQVCNAGMVYAALAIWDTDKESAKEIIQRSLDSNILAFDVYKPDGNYPEGYSYWDYGSTFQVLLVATLESSFGKNSKLYKSEGFLESARYIQYSVGTSGKCFNYSDCSDGGERMPVAMPWFANKLKDKSVLIPYRPALNPQNKFRSLTRELPIAVIFGIDTNFSNLPMPKSNIYVGHGENPIAMVRTNWEDGKGLYLGIKGGMGTVSHGHCDAGSFVFDTDEVRWAGDIPVKSYGSLEGRGVDLWNAKQNSERWSLLRYSNRTHNTLTINGKTHNVSGFAPIVEVFDTPEKRGAKLDMSQVLKEDLASATREIAIIDGARLEVLDEFETMKNDCIVSWNLSTQTEVKILDDNSIELKKKDKSLKITLETNAPYKAVIHSSKLLNPKDDELDGWTLVGFEIRAPKNTKIRAKAILQPK